MKSQSFSGVIIHIHTYTSSCLLESEDDRHTYTHPRLISRLQAYISRSASLKHFWSAYITCTSSWLMAREYLYPRLIACTNTHTPRGAILFHIAGAFPLHTCSVSRNLRSYFISVVRVLLKMVVLQTVLWDIRPWSAVF